MGDQRRTEKSKIDDGGRTRHVRSRARGISTRPMAGYGRPARRKNGRPDRPADRRADDTRWAAGRPAEGEGSALAMPGRWQSPPACPAMCSGSGPRATTSTRIRRSRDCRQCLRTKRAGDLRSADTDLRRRWLAARAEVAAAMPEVSADGLTYTHDREGYASTPQMSRSRPRPNGLDRTRVLPALGPNATAIEQRGSRARRLP